MRAVNLGGHSGCSVLLCEEDDHTSFVRKISGSKAYNERLKNQMLKQQQYHGKRMKTPSVIGSGMTQEGLFYFDMEYIQGITLAEYIKSIEIGKIRNCVEILLEDAADLQTESEADTAAFDHKIHSLDKLCGRFQNQVFSEAVGVLKKHDWSNFKETKCHGDLTLENIIIKDSQLYVIDFLDSFYDCWIMDVSTLMQDVQTMWSYRKEKPDINTLIRLIIFRDILLDKIKELAGEMYLDVYYALLMKLVRIYPYTKDHDTLKFLDVKTASVLDIIKEAEKT